MFNQTDNITPEQSITCHAVVKPKKPTMRRVHASRYHERESPRPSAADVLSPALARPRMTRGEAAVLGWLAHGLSNAEIALVLQLSLRTTHRHVARLLDTFGGEQRLAAMAVVHVLGTVRTLVP